MAKYLLEARYTLDGIRGVKSEGGTARATAATEAVESLGGQVESFYFAFGDPDVYLVVDLPDHISAAACAIAVGAGGGVQIRTTVLLTAGEIDAATNKQTSYRPPGG